MTARSTALGRLALMLSTIFIIFGIGAVLFDDSFRYPTAKRGDQADVYHGIEIADPYRWMENLESEDTKSWIKAQDELTSAYLQSIPARGMLLKRITDLSLFETISAPGKTDKGFFFVKTTSGTDPDNLLYYRKTLESEPERVYRKSDHFDKRFRVGGFWLSPNGRYFGYSFRELSGSSLEAPRRIFDLKTGKSLEEFADVPFHSWMQNGNFFWKADSSGFYYNAFERLSSGEEADEIILTVYYHAMGQPSSEDKLIYRAPKEDGISWLFMPDDKRHLVLSLNRGADKENRIYVKDLQRESSAFAPVFSRADAVYHFIENDGDVFWFATNRGAPNGRIVAHDIGRSELEEITEVIPESDDSALTSISTSRFTAGAHNVLGGHFVISYNKDVRMSLKVFDLKGSYKYDITFPEIAGFASGYRGTRFDDRMYFTYSGPFDSGTIYSHDFKTRKSVPFIEPGKTVNKADFVVKQVFYKSKDGTRVPMFIVHKKGIKLDGTNPCYLSAYGAWGWTLRVTYSARRIAWLEMGGMYAVANVRGGGAYGEEWHEAGMGRNYPNVINDVISAGEWLVENHYTKPEKLAVQGSSAGGKLAAAAAIWRPDLFGAAVCDLGVMDMVGSTRNANDSQQYGSSSNPDDFKVLHSYSPLHNVHAGQCYPAMLIRAGEKDPAVAPFYSYKFAAQLQHAQNCAHPTMLKVAWGAGHSIGSNFEKLMAAQADEIAFLVRALKLENRR